MHMPDDIFFVVLEAKQFAFLLIIHMKNQSTLIG